MASPVQSKEDSKVISETSARKNKSFYSKIDKKTSEIYQQLAEEKKKKCYQSNASVKWADHFKKYSHETHRSQRYKKYSLINNLWDIPNNHLRDDPHPIISYPNEHKPLISIDLTQNLTEEELLQNDHLEFNDFDLKLIEFDLD